MPAAVFTSPLGRLFLQEEEGGIARIALLAPGEAAPFCEGGPTPLLAEACRQLDAYFAGKLCRFDLPLFAAGTPFQMRVWEALRRIDYGTVKTYGDIAREVSSPLGFRAVGMACNRNPVIIVVPCHRVIGAGGKLTGFACGVDVKYRLLALEKSVLGQRPG